MNKLNKKKSDKKRSKNDSKFTLKLICRESGPNEDKVIGSSDSYSDIQTMMGDFLDNPENARRYKIDPWQTVHSWVKDTKNPRLQHKIIDFGDYTFFFEIDERI